MITGRSESLLLSNLGWVDRGSIWLHDTETGMTSRIAIGEGDFVRLHRGRDDLFAAALVRGHGQPWISVTIRRASAPTEVVGQWKFGDERAEGDATAWTLVPHVFVGYDPTQKDYVTILIDPTDRTVNVQSVEWFDETYDWGYQQPMTVTAVPGTELLLYSVQRSSQLVLYDPRTGRVERKITLAGRHGNPEPVFRTSTPEVWVSDYDHLVRLQPRTWEILDAKRLQFTSEGSRLFIGDFAFDARERRCAVARPFLGDAIVLDANSFTPIGEVMLGGQPLDIALLTDGRVFTRDWTAGELRTGRI